MQPGGATALGSRGGGRADLCSSSAPGPGLGPSRGQPCPCRAGGAGLGAGLGGQWQGRVLAAGRHGQNLPVCPGLEALPSLLFIFKNSFLVQDLWIYVFGFYLFVLTIQEEPVIWPLGTLACSRV